MRKAKWKTALVLAALLMLAGCDREVLEEPNPITVVVTVECKTGKMIQFIYLGETVWQSGLVKSMSYYRNDNMTYIDYTDLADQDKHLVFQGGKEVE